MKTLQTNQEFSSFTEAIIHQSGSFKTKKRDKGFSYDTLRDNTLLKVIQINMKRQFHLKIPTFLIRADH